MSFAFLRMIPKTRMRFGSRSQGLPISSKIAASGDKNLSARSYTIIAARFGDRGFHHDAKG